MNQREDPSLLIAVDRKLIFIVKKLLENHPNKSSDLLTDLVIERHREYQRKNREVLQSSIDSILNEKIFLVTRSTSLNHNNHHPVNPNNNLVVNKNHKKKNKLLKRKHDIDECTTTSQASSPSLHNNDTNNVFSTDHRTSESEYDQFAQQEDLLREQWVASPSYGGTSMLNAGLRSRYMTMQRDRELTTTTTIINEDNNNNTDTNIIQTQNTITDDTVATVHTTTASPLKTSITPKSKKKKVSNSERRRVSSSNASSLEMQSSSVSSTFFTPTPRPKERYSDLGGMSNILTQIRQLIEYPLMHPELFQHLGIDPPRGILLRGPPGCGKTHLANAIAGQLNVTFFRISSPEIIGGISGESESRIRDLFTIASQSAPSIVFLDELDAIAPKRGDGSSSSAGGGTGRGMEKRVVAQLLTSLDSLSPENNVNQAPVIVIGATNRPDAIDPALRRAGRFDREISLGVPDEQARECILRVMTTPRMRLTGDFDYKFLARKTPGFVGADLRSLTKEAAVVAINRIFKTMLMGDNTDEASKVSITDTAADALGFFITDTAADALGKSLESSSKLEPSNDPDISTVQPFTPSQLDPLFVTMNDFLEAIPHVQPSSKREGFATIPDVSWDNIGALQSIREELALSVLEPIQHPERFLALGIPLPAGVLLYGPPGCGKTLLAKAIANESGANFISVKGPELLDKYVGESERAVRVVFERARSSSPCIVFFDELDSLCPRRGIDSGSGSGVSERVVNQLLTEMDGLDSRRSIFVIAATNRPELIDPAMLRPGRLDKLLYVPLPVPDDRLSILIALSRKVNLAIDVDLKSIAYDFRAEGYSGADCAALLREAGLAVLRDMPRTISIDNHYPVTQDISTQGSLETSLQISMKHFDYAFAHVLPSVGKKDKANYEKIRERMARARARDNEKDD